MVILEGAQPQASIWSKVIAQAPESKRVVNPGAGSDLFQGKKKL